MVFQAFAPADRLSNCVEQFVLSCDDQPSRHVEQVLPSGLMQLVIDLREGRSTRSPGDRLAECGGIAMSGIQSRSIPLNAASMEAVICVPFKTGGAFRLFRCAADELRDAHVPLESLWGKAASDLRDQLLESAPAERLRVLEELLMQRLVADSWLHPAVRIAIRVFDESPSRAIGSVVKEVGLSERRFIQLFRQQVGTTPKQYCRIRRFQRSLQRIERERHPNWVHVALDCGYFDQSHFVNEFRTLAGMSPSQYLARSRPHRNHVVAADGSTLLDSSG